MIPFRATVQWMAACVKCNTVVLIGGFDALPGSQIPLPTLPDGWRNLGELGVLCSRHTVTIKNKPATTTKGQRCRVRPA